MKGIKFRILTILTALVMCLGSSTSAFASESQDNKDADKNATCYNLEVTSDGIASITDEKGNEVSSISPRSSISGYNQATLSGDPAGIIVYINSSGWGGMGVTIETSSSWHGYMSLDILGSDGSIPLEGRSIYSDKSTEINDLFHYNPAYYLFSFRGIPSGQSVSVKIWVYG